jgi:hypothetical protein
MGNMAQLNGEYKGQVIDANDPSKMDRARVRVKGVYDGIPDEHIPWAAWRSPTPSKKGGSTFKPVKGAKVWVRFLDGNINFPVYSGGVIESKDDLPKNAKDGRFILYESPNKGLCLTIDENSEDIEIKIKGYNTTLSTVMDMLVMHKHGIGQIVGSVGITTGASTTTPTGGGTGIPEVPTPIEGTWPTEWYVKDDLNKGALK